MEHFSSETGNEFPLNVSLEINIFDSNLCALLCVCVCVCVCVCFYLEIIWFPFILLLGQVRISTFFSIFPKGDTDFLITALSTLVMSATQFYKPCARLLS